MDAKALEYMKGAVSKTDAPSLDRYARFFALMSKRLSKQQQMLEFLKFVPSDSARSFLKRYKEFEVLYTFDQTSGNWELAAESAELKCCFKDAFEFSRESWQHRIRVECFSKVLSSSEISFG